MKFKQETITLRVAQVNWEARRVSSDGEEFGLLGLLNDGVDVADVGDGLEDLLVEALIESALILGLLDHLVVVLHQSSPQPRLLVLPHLPLTITQA